MERNGLMCMRMRVCVLMVFLMLVVLLASCREASVLKKSYDVIKSAEITYSSAQQILNDMDDRGQLTEDQKASIVEVARKYYAAVKLSKSALIAYKTALEKGEDANAAEIALATALNGIAAIEPELLNMLVQ